MLHAVINPVIVLFLGWEVGLGQGGVPDEEEGRQWRGEGGRGEGRRGGGRVVQLKPSAYFWSEFGCKCSYCFMDFTHECQTMLRGLVSYQTSVHVSRFKHIKTHACRHEAVFVSCCEKEGNVHAHHLLLRLGKHIILYEDDTPTHTHAGSQYYVLCRRPEHKRHKCSVTQ